MSPHPTCLVPNQARAWSPLSHRAWSPLSDDSPTLMCTNLPFKQGKRTRGTPEGVTMDVLHAGLKAYMAAQAEVVNKREQERDKERKKNRKTMQCLVMLLMDKMQK